MEVAITSMKNIANLQSISCTDFADSPQDVGKFCAWDDTILNIKLWTDASYRAKGILTTSPEELAFCFIPGNANDASCMLITYSHYLPDLFCNAFAQSLRL